MKKKILLIEDDVVVRENTAEILKLANYNVLTSSNGKDGIAKAKAYHPDLIICDILMPELDGYGVLQIIMRSKKLQKTPFIFMSAKTNHADIRRGMNLGASDYITKPFEESELLSAIESRLKKNEIYKNKPEKESAEIIKKIRFEDLEKVFKNKEKFTYKKGKTIYCKGNSSNFIFYIARGEVKTYSTHEDGKELISGIFEKHDFFGFTSLSKNIPYHENAVAIKRSELLKINKKEMYDLIKQNPQIAINFMDILTVSYNNLKEHLVHLVYDSVRKKTAESLLLLNEKSGDNEIEISRYDLASLIGIAKETLIRALAEFKEEGVIETSRNSIKITDIVKLKSIK
jgi:DNA-binding response OmpR family regulator